MGMFLLWLVLSAFVGLFGSERKIGFGGAFALSLFLSPLVGLIFTALSKSNADVKREAEMLHLQQQQAAALQNMQSQAPEQPKPAPILPADPQARVNRLRELRDTGAITQDEFLDLVSRG